MEVQCRNTEAQSVNFAIVNQGNHVIIITVANYAAVLVVLALLQLTSSQKHNAGTLLVECIALSTL